MADHGADGVVTSAIVRVREGQTLDLTLVLSAASAVRGGVVDTEGHPIVGAVVSVEGVPWIVRASSDDGGAFRRHDRARGRGGHTASGAALARGYRTGRVPLGARSDQTELVVRIVLTAASPVAGDVQDNEGNPVSARVVACEDQPAEARTQSAADGTFQLPASAIGCDAVAEHADYGSSSGVTVVESRHLVLRLKAGGAIDGVVVDERGTPMTSFALGIESFAPARGRSFDHGGARNVDDPRGAFRWEKLAPGSYVLTASVTGRPPARSASIDVQGGGVTSGVRIVIGPGGALAGRVYDEAHRPLSGVDLRFDAVSRVADSKAATQSDDAGQYRLEGTPEGPFTVRVHKDGYRVRLESGLRVSAGATVQRDFTLAFFDGGAGIEFGGIGANLAPSPDGLVMQNVFPNDPAARAGLRPGDRIVRIDGEPTDGMSIADALQRIRGEPGTVVGISALRPETGEIVDLTIVRGDVVQ